VSVEAKELRAAALAVFAALFVQFGAGHWLAGRDLLQGLLGRFDFLSIALALTLFAARLFSFFLAPGWLAYAVIRFSASKLRERAYRARWVKSR
jgi:hypothetical protein